MLSKKILPAIVTLALLLSLSGSHGRALAADTNLFANPSLETGTMVPDSWNKSVWGTNTTKFTYPVAGQDGARAAQVAMTKYTKGDAKWYPNEVPVTAGQQLTFSNWSKSNVVTYVDVQYRNVSGTYSYVSLGTVTGNNTWINFQKTFIVPAGVSAMTVFHSIKKVGTLVVDNYSLTSSSSVPAPTLTFSTASSTIPYNTGTTLTWSATNATTCTASGDWTGSKAVSGTESTGNLTASRTYSLTCTGPGGTTTPKSVTVTVGSVPVPTLTLSAASSTVPYNTGTTLTWSSTNATACTATGDWTGAKAVSGTESTGNLTASKTYTLTCTGPGGTSTPRSVTVTVASLPAPILIFSAASTTVPFNSSTNLTWSSTNATVCTATGDWIGTKAISGSESTGNLTSNKTYTLTCTGPGGTTAPKSVTVTVGAPDPTLIFSAASTTIPYNTGTTLTWSATNTTSCTATGDWTGAKAISGTESTGNLTVNKTYTLACTGPGGTTAPITVTITVAEQSTNLISNPSLENGTDSPTDWTADGWGTNTSVFTYPVSGHTGLRGAKAEITSYRNGDIKWMHKELPTSGGKAYKFSSWYSSNAATSFNVQYRMSDGSYQYFWLGDISSSQGQWKQFTKILTVPNGAVGMIIFQALATTGSVTVDDYQLNELIAQFAQGMVSLDFDDGWKSIYTVGIPILNAAGIKSTQYIVTGALGDSDGEYMTQADVLSMAAAGHEIGSHTRTHPETLATISATQAHDEIFGSLADLQAMGLDPKTFCYPYGVYNDSIIQMVKDAGYIGARSVDDGFNIPDSNPYVLMDKHVEKTVTVADAKGWIDQAVANKQWLIMEFHEQRTDGDTWSNDPVVLQGIVDYIKQQNVKTVTMSEGIGLMSQQ